MTAIITGDQTNTVGLINSKTAVASTSGTSIDFTGIPAGTKRITVMFNGVSLSGTSAVQVQLGAGSVTTSGYTSSTSYIPTAASPTTGRYTSGFVTQAYAAANTRTGVIAFSNITGNTWIGSGVLALGDVDVTVTVAGQLALSGALDRIRITTVNGTDTFDAGSINILYE